MSKINKSNNLRYRDPTPYTQRDYAPDEEWNDFIESAADIVDPSRVVARRRKINEEISKRIEEAMGSSEGRQSLAEAMCAPIRRSLDYSGIGSRLLMVDDLPQGAYATYEKT